MTGRGTGTANSRERDTAGAWTGRWRRNWWTTEAAESWGTVAGQV